MQAITLRPYQQDLKNAVYNDWNGGAENVLAVLETGGGKSVIVSDIVLDGARANQQQAVIAHRNELVSQMSMHIANRGIPHRIIGSNATIAQITRQHRNQYGRSFINPSAQTAVVGVDTLIARADDVQKWCEQTDRWIIDEAHHVIGGANPNKWGKAVNLFKNAHGLGVTATPLRADGQGLGREYDGVFDTMCIGPTMRDLINIGALCDYEIACPESDLKLSDDDLAASGDWSNKKLKTAAQKSHIVGDIVENYKKHAYSKQAICFATDVETASDIARRFNDSGIRAAALSAKTPFNVREKYITEFKEGKLLILVNVDLFDEGFDVPACEVVIMARPTASLGKYRQMVGRCLRTADGKQYGLIIDHVGNVVRHKLPDRVIAWTLARRDKRAKSAPDPNDIPLTVCTECTKPYERFYPHCPYCGHVPPLPEPRSRTIEQVDGDLILLDRAKLEEMRKAMELENPADLAARVGHVAGDFAGRGAANKQLEKIEAAGRLRDAIEQWAGIERAAGFSDSQIYRKFYLTMGMDVMSAMDGSRSRAEFEQIANTVKGWYE